MLASYHAGFNMLFGLQRLALSAARRLNGDDHEDVVETEQRLGNFFCETRRFEEGLTLATSFAGAARGAVRAYEPHRPPRREAARNTCRKSCSLGFSANQPALGRNGW